MKTAMAMILGMLVPAGVFGAGPPGELRKLAEAHGLDRSTVYWRSVETPPREAKLGGAVPLKWDSLEQYIEQSYADGMARNRRRAKCGPCERES